MREQVKSVIVLTPQSFQPTGGTMLVVWQIAATDEVDFRICEWLQNSFKPSRWKGHVVIKIDEDLRMTRIQRLMTPGD